MELDWNCCRVVRRDESYTEGNDSFMSFEGNGCWICVWPGNEAGPGTNSMFLRKGRADEEGGSVFCSFSIFEQYQ